jgi:Protein of unknown function (DUF2488)
MKKVKYYFVIASKEFLVKEEPIEEVLRERVYYYKQKKKRIDFWLLPNPEFLDTNAYINLSAKFPKNCLAIISTNKIFITWLKLRLQNVFIGKFVAPTEEIKNPLGFKPN